MWLYIRAILAAVPVRPVTDHLKVYESGQQPGGIGAELMDNIVIIVARLSSSSGRGRRRVEVARVV
jgi:hypothetical protein